MCVLQFISLFPVYSESLPFCYFYALLSLRNLSPLILQILPSLHFHFSISEVLIVQVVTYQFTYFSILLFPFLFVSSWRFPPLKVPHYVVALSFRTRPHLQSLHTVFSIEHRIYYLHLRLLTFHGILQARIVEWVAVFYSKGASWPRGQTCISRVSCIGKQILYHSATWEVPCSLLQVIILSCAHCRWQGDIFSLFKVSAVSSVI